MTDSIDVVKSYYPDYWEEGPDRQCWPTVYQPSERLEAGRDPAHPNFIFSPLHGVMEVWHPTRRRATLDRFCWRLEESGVTGSDLAVAYLHEKYSWNLATSTLSQAGGVLLSFLQFLSEFRVDFFQLTSQDVGMFVGRDQDNSLKSGAISTKLRALYAFIRFLVDKEILSFELLHKKIRVKWEQPLPIAIPLEDIKSLLLTIRTIHDRVLILLLLRTGIRIGELLNVAISDLHLSERKILIYQGEKNFQGRVVYFSKDAEEALRRWLTIRHPTKTYLLTVIGHSLTDYSRW